jgi:CRISPR-associated protein Cas6/Cse3/CasE subtype I-E
MSTIDMAGQLLITDVDAFIPALYKGIGSAKGMGCGLLLVQRAL